ncbi:ABC transporter permease [Brooklawnia cerclae]|uniref:Peptide/nickel transport system permease protein n=1 Tax=Brooklawnia cerclae TaxID=349934 RepID=A0ABX0SGS5_9ACTN|nr:ABC transporter permease [Brooklawnia cerclae]NIH57602.1 peptide/nickel transport system permease protein [Brooklawnia cerclae]
MLQTQQPALGTTVARTRPAFPWGRTVAAFLPLVLIIAVAVLAPVITPYDPVRTVGAARTPPSAEFWFGTDAVGMDVFSRVIYGARIAVRFGITVALWATGLGILLGTFIGLSESSRGILSTVGRTLNRISDYIIAIPDIILAVVVVGIMGSSDLALTVAIILALVQAPIKLTRMEVLRVRNEAYLEAAELAGEGRLHSAFVHVIPNSLGPAMRNMPLIFGNCVIILASLGFIGVGVDAPTPEWGYMISSGLSSLMLGRWWESVFPAVAVFLSVLGIAYSSRAIPKMWPRIAAHVKNRPSKKRNDQCPVEEEL